MEKNHACLGGFAARSHVESSFRCERWLWVPLPRQRPPLPTAWYFLLHLTKGGQGNWFSSLMFPPVLCQRHQPSPAGCDVFSLGSRKRYITRCLSPAVRVRFSLAVSCRGGVSRLVTRGFGQKHWVLFLLSALVSGRLSPHSCKAGRLSHCLLLLKARRGPSPGRAGPRGKKKYGMCPRVTASLVKSRAWRP